MPKWLILTGTGKAVRGRHKGTRAQAEKYCRDHYLPHSYKIVPDIGAESRMVSEGGAAHYEVRADIGVRLMGSPKSKGKRSQTSMGFRTKAAAQKYADDTNRDRRSANARVVKIS